MNDLYLIRGQRIIEAIIAHEEEALLEASTYSGLERNIVRGFPRTRKRQFATDPIQIVQLSLIPAVPSKTLYVKGVARSRVKKYDPEMRFMKVEFQKEEAPNNVTFMANDEKEYTIVPISLSQKNVKVRCNCLDMYFRFSHYNYSDGSLSGRLPRPYRRKTTNYPPVNPMRVPGVCKHLIKLVMALSQAGLVKP